MNKENFAGNSKGENRREEILSAAAQLISTRSYSTVSLTEIANKVNLRKQSLYHYFGSKEDIFYEILLDVVSGLIQDLKRITELSVSPAERLKQAIYLHVSKFFENEAKMKVYAEVEWEVLEPKRRREFRALERQYDEMFDGILREGIANSAFRSDLDVRIVEFAIIGMMYHMAKWYSPAGRLSAEEIANNYVRLLLEGIYACDSKQGHDKTKYTLITHGKK